MLVSNFQLTVGEEEFEACCSIPGVSNALVLEAGGGSLVSLLFHQSLGSWNAGTRGSLEEDAAS